MLPTNLKRIRTERNIKQADLAAAVGLSQSASSLIENGLRSPRRTTVLMLCLTLGVSVEELARKGVEDVA